ncbi:MAG TPA: hypothetical protein VLJ62_23780, partial [Burkholderiaceae bacterium]|nr:hypothetical protein [Burkholderiaceae bacterium]
AWLHAGAARAAWALAEPLQAPPFTLHPAAVLALRLRTACAAGANTAALVAAARDALPQALPLEAIELLAALSRALADGDAAALKAEARARLHALAATIDDAALHDRFVACHDALIGG